LIYPVIFSSSLVFCLSIFVYPLFRPEPDIDLSPSLDSHTIPPALTSMMGHFGGSNYGNFAGSFTLPTFPPSPLHL
jgi:hypothetical protein